jgi:hypothetical protein
VKRRWRMALALPAIRAGPPPASQGEIWRELHFILHNIPAGPSAAKCNMSARSGGSEGRVDHVRAQGVAGRQFGVVEIACRIPRQAQPLHDSP